MLGDPNLYKNIIILKMMGLLVLSNALRSMFFNNIEVNSVIKTTIKSAETQDLRPIWLLLDIVSVTMLFYVPFK